MPYEIDKHHLALAADVLVTDAQELVSCGSEEVEADVAARLEAADAISRAIAPPRASAACLKCGASSLDYDNLDFDDGRISQEVICVACNWTWTDYYDYSGSVHW